MKKTTKFIPLKEIFKIRFVKYGDMLMTLGLQDMVQMVETHMAMF